MRNLVSDSKPSQSIDIAALVITLGSHFGETCA
jgi:hypothetical protein